MVWKQTKWAHFWPCSFSLHLEKFEAFWFVWLGDLALYIKADGSKKNLSFHVNYSHLLQLTLRSFRALQTPALGMEGQRKNWIWPTSIFQFLLFSPLTHRSPSATVFSSSLHMNYCPELHLLVSEEFRKPQERRLLPATLRVFKCFNSMRQEGQIPMVGRNANKSQGSIWQITFMNWTTEKNF